VRWSTIVGHHAIAFAVAIEHHRGERADRLANLLDIHIADLTVADCGDGFCTFTHGIDHGFIHRFMPDEVSPQFLADKVEHAIANLRRGALQASDEPFNGIRLRPREDAVDLARGQVHALRESLHADTLHQIGESAQRLFIELLIRLSAHLLASSICGAERRMPCTHTLSTGYHGSRRCESLSFEKRSHARLSDRGWFVSCTMGSMPEPARIRITEVGPRDGLQNEPVPIPTDKKVAFIDLLSESGVDEIEAGSFVNPQWVPQLRDSEDVFKLIKRPKGVVFSALVPNERGMERAMSLGIKHRPDKIAIFTAASETFAKKNTNATIDETVERFRPVIVQAKAAGVPLRVYISCAVHCPYEGPIAPEQVCSVVRKLREIGIDPESDDLDLGETIGIATPADIERLYEGLHTEVLPEQTTLHMHDTRGTALACIYAAMRLGVASFDASCAGIGGCPFAPGAAGNIATEDLVHLCRREGRTIGVNLPRLFAAGRYIRAVLQRPLAGKVFSVDGG
jgi:hydroxymethylglutaryl-CoA lyase